MNIIEIKGGLGNQMFQAALCIAFKEKGIPAAADLSFYNSGKQERDLALDFFPQMHLATANEREAARLRGYGYHDSLLEKVRRRVRPSTARIYQEDVRKGYQPEVFDQQDTYISGYWQCEKYFAEYRDELLKRFCFPKLQDEACKKMRDQILNTETPVSLHVRRGDYLSSKYSEVYRDICTELYYQRAMSLMREEYSGCRFYVFSDDLSWCRTHLGGTDLTFIDCNSGKNSPYDMYLMSICKHNIVANSSFSWWGAWLNQNKEKEVMAPERWFHHMDVTDQICDTWRRIPIT